MPARCPKPSKGVTAVELTVVLAIVGLLAVIAVPTFTRQLERAKTDLAIGQIGALQVAIDKYELARGALPLTFADLPNVPPLDPWGKPYEFLNFAAGGKGKQRKDHALHPINTSYDLYSRGPDGNTQPPLTAKPSLDDIVRGRDGSFIGIAEDF